jgi:hypothetical protein
MGLFNRMKDPVEGMAQVISSSAPPRATSGNCKMTLVVQADGVPATSAHVHDIVSTKRWPFPGTVLPVQVDRANPEKVKVLWDKVPSHEESAQADADALAAMMRGETPPGSTPPGFDPTMLSGGTGDIVSQLQHMFPGAHIQVEGTAMTAPAAGTGWAPPTPGATQDDFADDRIEALERLAKLHASGALTDAEFAAEKRRVLGG